MSNEMLDIIQSPAEKGHILSAVFPALHLVGSLLFVQTLSHLACVTAVSRMWTSWAWCLGSRGQRCRSEVHGEEVVSSSVFLTIPRRRSPVGAAMTFNTFLPLASFFFSNKGRGQSRPQSQSDCRQLEFNSTHLILWFLIRFILYFWPVIRIFCL